MRRMQQPAMPRLLVDDGSGSTVEIGYLT